MDTKINVIFSTRLSKEESEPLVDAIKNSAGCDVDVYNVINYEGISLALVYGQLLKQQALKANKITVLVHDDVEFLRDGWGTELIRLFEDNPKYGIIGVAGSAEFDKNGAWWNYNKKYGQVVHKANGKVWLSAFSDLLKKDLEEVCVIDGLFMAVHMDRFSKNFDMTLEGFNFYDIDFCLANYFDGKCKIGVTTNIRLAHKSVGELSDNWYENKEKIIKKYKNNLPISIKK